VRAVDPAIAQRQREKERAYRVQAMRSARAFWNDARPLSRIHPYIDGKGLSPLGCAGLRQSDGLLVVPVWHGEWVVSVQTITPKGEKRFWPGAPVKGGAYVIDRPRAALTVLCEGLATGLALYKSVKQARVVVCFDAGNILPVVDRMRPTGSVVIAADNDHGTQARRGFNPGLEKARNAAELIGAGVAYPEGIEGTDMADMLRELGQGAAKRIERVVLAGARYVASTA
jgi:putative DNA primase/helicase